MARIARRRQRLGLYSLAVVAVFSAVTLALIAGRTSAANSAGSAAKPIKIGILTTCGGPFAVFEKESFFGAKLALVDRGGKLQGSSPESGVSGVSVGGHPIKLSFGCSDATPDKAVSEARRLVEQVGVDVLLGPLSGDEGIAVASYAKKQPGKTFVNGTSGAQQTTLKVKAPNFFRFGGDGAQWMAGLGAYAYKTLHWRTAAILGEDYSYPQTQAAGFIAEFCSLGGKIASKRIWVPLGTTDWSSPVAQVPRNVDGFVVLTGGTDTVAVQKAYLALGGDLAKKTVGGSSTMDPTDFVVGDSLDGVAGASPVPLGSTSAAWKRWSSAFAKSFPKDAGLADSLFSVLYYNGMNAILQALGKVKGDVSGGEAKFRKALGGLHLNTPNGPIRLDKNRNAIENNYIVQIVKKNGKLAFKTLKTVRNVSETFGGLFGPSSPAPARNSPPCKKGTPPPWAR